MASPQGSPTRSDAPSVLGLSPTALGSRAQTTGFTPQAGGAGGPKPTNDYLRTQSEIDAPNRRGALSAASILSHLPERAFAELQRKWGSRELDEDAFVALLRPVVGGAGFFDEHGNRIDSAWQREGWIGTTVPGCGAAMSPEASFRTTHLDAYLHNVFGLIDAGATQRLSWQQFTMYLVEGISGLTSDAGVTNKNVEEDIEYAFRGEFTMPSLGPLDTSREWFSKLRYLPQMDSMLAVSRHRVKLLGVGRREREVTMPCDDSVVATAEYVPSRNLCLVSTFDHELRGFFVTRGKAKDVLRMKFPLLKTEDVVSSMYNYSGSKLFAGSRSGALLSTRVGEHGLGKFSLHDTTMTKPHSDAVTCITPLPHNTTIVTGSLDRTLYIFDSMGGIAREKEFVAKGHGHGILCSDFSSNFTVFLSGGFESRVLVWADNLWDKPIFTLSDAQKPLDTVVGIRAIPSTPYVAVGDSRGILKLFDLRTRGVVETLGIADEDNFATGLIRRDHIRRQGDAGVTKHTDGGAPAPKAVASASVNNISSTAYFACLEYTGSQHRQLVFGGARMFYFGMASDAQDNPLLTCDEGRKIIATAGMPGTVLTVTDRDLVSWSASNGQPDMRRQFGARIATALVLHEAGVVVAGHKDGRITSHYLTTSIMLRQLHGAHEAPIVAVRRYGTDGLITACEDMHVCVWRADMLLPDLDKKEDKARVSPSQTFVLEEPIVDVIVADTETLLLVVTASTISVYSLMVEFRRWVHSHDVPLAALSWSPPPSAAAPRSRRGTTARTAPPPPRPAKLTARAEDEVITAVSLSTFPRAGHRRHRLLCVTSTAGAIRMWDVDVVTAATKPIGALGTPSVARRLLPRLQESVSPAVHCVAFSATRPWAVATGDDLGRVTLWAIPEYVDPRLRRTVPVVPPSPRADADGHACASPKRRLTIDIVDPADVHTTTGVSPPRGNDETLVLEEVATHAVHEQCVVDVRIVDYPLDGIVSTGAENVVVISSWDAVPLARLQQGPLVMRVWQLQAQECTPLRFAAVLGWQRVRSAVHSGRLAELLEAGATALLTPIDPLWECDTDDADESIEASDTRRKSVASVITPMARSLMSGPSPISTTKRRSTQTPKNLALRRQSELLHQVDGEASSMSASSVPSALEKPLDIHELHRRLRQQKSGGVASVTNRVRLPTQLVDPRCAVLTEPTAQSIADTTPARRYAPASKLPKATINEDIIRLLHHRPLPVSKTHLPPLGEDPSPGKEATQRGDGVLRRPVHHVHFHRGATTPPPAPPELEPEHARVPIYERPVSPRGNHHPARRSAPHALTPAPGPARGSGGGTATFDRPVVMARRSVSLQQPRRGVVAAATTSGAQRQGRPPATLMFPLAE